MIALLAAISLPSAVWTTFQYLLDGQWQILLLVGLVAALGKLTGGLLADRLGWRRWTVGALLAAAVLLPFGHSSLLALLAGIGLLQSAVPASLLLAVRLLPRPPATASGLVFGLAVVLGSVPLLGGFGPPLGQPVALAILAATAALGYWIVGRRSAARPA